MSLNGHSPQPDTPREEHVKVKCGGFAGQKDRSFSNLRLRGVTVSIDEQERPTQEKARRDMSDRRYSTQLVISNRQVCQVKQ